MRARCGAVARRLQHVDAGWWCLAAGLVFVMVVWWPVLVGRRTLLGGDILYQFIPWADGSPHVPHNPILSDPVSQFVTALSLFRQDLASGQLPLWNPYTLNGTPLLGNGTSAVLSPFTWMALPFQPDRGYSLAMLARFIVAGTGMAFFVRQLGARGVSAALAGVAYASSSWMVVWLGHPQSGVAAILPWAFGFAEVYLRNRSPRALAGLAVSVALQLFAGNEETSFHMGVFLALWVALRALSQPDSRFRRLVTLSAAGTLGAALAAVQLLPFLSGLQGSSLAEDRRRSGAGLGSLANSELASWLIPNGHGNPGIDQVIGRPPNYAESTAFIGVGALVLVVPGAWLLWRTARSVSILLMGGLLFAGLTVYGEITGVVGRLPGFDASNNARLTVLACFCGAALAGAGLERVLRSPVRLPWRATVAPLAPAWACIAGLGACALVLKRNGAAVDHLFGPFHGQIGFWVVVLALSLGSAVLLFAAGMMGSARPWVAGGFLTLALAEALLFAAPFQPRTLPGDNPPKSAAMDWLHARIGNDKFAAPGLAVLPNLSERYGLYDTRGVDVLLNSRLRTFWREADPKYDDSVLYTQLITPGEEWLAAAGVRWYLTAPQASLPKTLMRYRSGPTAIAELPNSRPFAFGVATGSVIEAPNAAAAAAIMAREPLGPVVVEGCCGATSAPTSPPALQPVTVVSRDQGAMTLQVMMPHNGVVVLLQSYASGWSAQVDGNPVSIHPADVLFQAVSVSAGSHSITLRYRPASFVLGTTVSAVSLLIVAFLCAPEAWRARLSESVVAPLLARRSRDMVAR